jgi:hypothetical protein
MSNSRQFLIPINYDITKEIYTNDDIVRKRQYVITGLNSIKKYHHIISNTSLEEANFESKFYADKLRHQAKH